MIEQEPEKEINEQGLPGIHIPGEILFNPFFNFTEKALFGFIKNMDKTKRGCWAGNDYLAQLMGVKQQTITNAVTKLEQYGYIRVIRKKLKRNIYINTSLYTNYRELVVLFHEVYVNKKIDKKDKKDKEIALKSLCSRIKILIQEYKNFNVPINNKNIIENIIEKINFSKEKGISKEIPLPQSSSSKIKPFRIKLNRRTPYVKKPYQEPKEETQRKRSKLKHKEKTYPKKESHARSISEETYCAKECKPLFDYWNSLSDVRRTPISNKTKTCPRANKFLKEILLKYDDRQIKRSMRFYNELLASEDTILNKIIPGCHVGLDEFFSFSRYTKKRIEKSNPIYNVKSWFIECMESLSVLEIKYGKYREDPNPTLTNKIIKFYRNRKETKNNFSIKDINAFRLASKKFIKFFKTYKGRLDVGIHEMDKPVLCVKYLFEALEENINEDWKMALPTWLASDTMFDHRLINYFKKKGMLLDRKTTDIYEYVPREPVDYSIEEDHFSD